MAVKRWCGKSTNYLLVHWAEIEPFSYVVNFGPEPCTFPTQILNSVYITNESWSLLLIEMVTKLNSECFGYGFGLPTYVTSDTSLHTLRLEQPAWKVGT